MNKKEIVCYNTDASRLVGKAKKVVFPKTIGEVQKLVQTSEVDIVPRGAGSGVMGGVIPDNSIVVDMSKMDKVSNFDLLNKVVHVEAGITIKELNEKLAKIGFEFPIQPNKQRISSIGGMIAMNAVGNRSMRYGLMKDWIEEIEFVNGRGELMKTSKSDLMDICGREGITGIVVAATLKIIPKIKRSASLFQSDSLEEILSIIRRLKLEKDLCLLNLFPPEVSLLLGFPEKYHLLIEFDSDRGKIRGEEYKVMSELNDKVFYTLQGEGYYDIEDGKFFFDKVENFILFLEENKIPYLGKIGIGIIYAFFKDEDKEKKKKTIKTIDRMGGKPGEYGIGLKRKHINDSFETKIIQRVKLRHDPFGKINKNKVIYFDSKEKIKEPDFEPKEKLDEEVSHLKSIGREEIEELKPLIEEPNEFIEELKTPEEKMEEFIEKVDLIDEGENFKEKPEIEEALNFDIKTRLEDYESTYESELASERKENIEEFAKNIAHNIIHPKPHIHGAEEIKQEKEEKKKEETEEKEKKILKEVEEKIEIREKEEEVLEEVKEKIEEPDRFKIDDPNVEKRGKLSKEEEDEVKRVMFGG
tara:strand:+ start:7104 stop:8855 length:1752 start_codon:yes stop_codon:yes gene_type:complete